jgi:cyclopropane fatty-acyl-phospholipid synthase-like methyltransferase
MTQHANRHAENVGEYYNLVSDVFIEYSDGNMHLGYWFDERDHSTYQQASERMTDALSRRLDPRPGQRVLDVGCGVGTPGIRLARARAVQVVGISISKDQIARANERAHAEGVSDTVRFEHADATLLPFPDSSFDAAWAMESMLHMDREQALREIVRVLRPGGRLVISDFILRRPISDDRKPLFVKLRDSSAVHEIESLSRYRELVEQSGLVTLDVADISTHAARTSSVVSDELQAFKEEIVRKGGPASFERMISDIDIHAGLPEIGYALISAQKP